MCYFAILLNLCIVFIEFKTAQVSVYLIPKLKKKKNSVALVR
jgi:hypothetical protein